jgi:hypothetical protein
MQDDPCTFYWQEEMANRRTPSASLRTFEDASDLGQVSAQAPAILPINLRKEFAGVGDDALLSDKSCAVQQPA